MPKSILIVDDSPQVRKIVHTHFDCEAHFKVCGEAVDGADAIEKARQLHPDLIILDASMPNMSGLQAAPILRAMDKKVPIVLFTLHAEAISASEASAAGITCVVSKMESLFDLSKRLENLLS
jgi:DNA-binding NarL/FixJ family response regulator